MFATVYGLASAKPPIGPRVNTAVFISRPEQSFEVIRESWVGSHCSERPDCEYLGRGKEALLTFPGEFPHIWSRIEESNALGGIPAKKGIWW